MYVISHIKDDGKREFIYSDSYTGGYPGISDDIEGSGFVSYNSAIEYINTIDKLNLWKYLGGITKKDVQIELAVVSYTFTKVKDYL